MNLEVAHSSMIGRAAELIAGDELKIHQGAEQVTGDALHHAVRPAFFQGATAHGLLNEVAGVLFGHFAGPGSILEPEDLADEVVEDEVRTGGVNQGQLAKQPTRRAGQQKLPPLAPQLPAAHAVEIGGGGRNRTDEWGFCRALPYHLATPPSERTDCRDCLLYTSPSPRD